MILRMAKVLLAGPKELSLAVLTLVQHLGVMHLDTLPAAQEFEPIDQYLKKLSTEQALVEEGLFLNTLRQQIVELCQLLGDRAIKPSHIGPQTALHSLPPLLPRHRQQCRGWSEAVTRNRQRRQALADYARLLQAVEALIPDPAGFLALEAIGVVIKDPEAFAELLALLKEEGVTTLEVKVLEPAAEEGRLGLLIAERDAAQRLHELLERHGVAELQCPEESLAALPFAEKRTAGARMAAECEQQLQEAEGKLAAFARQWGGVYQNLGRWIEERLAVLAASSAVCETAFCFFLVGWIPAAEVENLGQQVRHQFGDRVLVEELEVFEHDLEKIPIALRNPAYFQPFELFSRLLPLPSYSSFDITPYLAIFFPIFFGLMLGDVGYGLLLFLLALILFWRSRTQRAVNDAAKILVVSSCYAIIFGVGYGEFFGELGHLHLGLPTGLVKRQSAIVPMFVFSIALGVVHVTIGLLLGAVSAWKRGLKKEAFFKLVSILTILLLLTAGVLHWGKVQVIPGKFFALALATMSGVLLFCGGILAPLEVVKHFGSIVSYARIMAIGLTSVLLAEVANQLAGMMGSLWVGLLVAVLLHTFNIVLGLFAPTIHALRLHYVEFFSKYMEVGGRAFKPLRK